MDDETAKKVLADIVLSAVLHPVFPDRFETVSRPVLDQARMLLDDEDLQQAAERARARREREDQS